MFKLTLFIGVLCTVELPLGLASPQYYTYGVPRVAAPAAFPAFPAAPAVVPQPQAPRVLPVQQDAGALELLPPLQHVVGTRYPAVSPGRGYRFPISQLLNPTPPPNLKH